MADLIRDAPLGQIIRYLSRNKLLRYADEKPGFTLPEPWLALLNNDIDVSDLPTPDPSTPAPVAKADSSSASADAELQAVTKTRSVPIVPEKTKDGKVLVTWYATDDPEDPHNWTNVRRGLIAAIICLYTFVVYTTSAIYTSSTEGVMREFGVSQLKASLGLSLYVLGYGVGPLLFSPLSEIPRIGRNPVYAVTMALFVVVSIPTAFAPNFPGLMVLRFLQGFFGSPCLASGGASLGDMYSFPSLPYAMMAWVAAAYCGPALGPLLSGFSVPVMGWRWSLYESLWASAPVLVLMLLALPETSADNILLRRAARLRASTGSGKLLAQSEIDQAKMKMGAVFLDALIKPMEITIKDPAVMFVQIYTAIIYGIYYSCKSRLQLLASRQSRQPSCSHSPLFFRSLSFSQYAPGLTRRLSL